MLRGPEVDRGCAAASEVAAFCPVLVVGCNQGDTEGSCPDNVPAATPCIHLCSCREEGVCD